MEDARIIELYWSRDEEAIVQTKRSYGEKLRSIAYGILKNREDAEESENETYLNTWNAIPPQRPQFFFAFLAKICRNISLHRFDWLHAGKRSAEFVQLTTELEQCLPDPTAEKRCEAEELGRIISGFLMTLSRENRVIFVRRYFLAESVHDISNLLSISESKVKSSLFRTRNKLRDCLEKEGVTV